MSLMNIVVSAFSYLLLILLACTWEAKWLRYSAIVLCPILIYLTLWALGLERFILDDMIGHAIGLSAGIIICRLVNKQVENQK